MVNKFFQFVNSNNRGILLALVFLIGVGGVVLGSVSLRRSISAPYSIAALNSESGEANNLPTALIDTDGDSLPDSDELVIYGTSPYLSDSDSDGISDSEELQQGTDPNCPEGANCGAADVDTSTLENETASPIDSIGVTADPLAAQLRVALRQAGVPAEAVAALSDEEVVAAYEQAVAGQEEQNQLPPAAQFSGLSPEEIRALLLQGGIDQSTVDELSDTELLELYKETLSKLESE